MKYKNIVALATKVKKYTEKHHTLLKEATIDNKTYKYYEFAYYFAEFIKQGGKSVEDKKVKKQTKSTGEKIVESVTDSDYRDQAKRICQFIKQNGRIPNSVSTVKSKKTVRVRDYIYAFAKIIVFYGSHTRFPLTCKYDSTVFNKPSKAVKHGHATKSGCDNRGQNNSYYCGCHSLQEVFRNLYGIVVPQKTIARWCGTTSSGTSHDGLNTGVAKFNKEYNKNLKVKWVNFSELGWNGIKKICESDDKDCVIHNLYRNKWGHYETVNGVSSNVNVQNSLGYKCDKGCYCGYIEYRTQSTFRSYISGISQKSVMILTRG